MTLWLASNVGDNQIAKREILNLFSDNDPFGTPKPEKLIQTIIEIATNPGDIVLDFFLGSGTTAAVAQKVDGGTSASKWVSMRSPIARLGLRK